MVLIADGDQDARMEPDLPADKHRFDALRVGIGGYNEEFPPVDDVCPICFGCFTVPCRSNCGHWFCASCIVEYWMFGTSVQPCKCPMCYRQIINLKPEASRLIHRADDDADALEKVHQYNALYGCGFFHRAGVFPILGKKIFNVLIDPEYMRSIYYILRLFGLFLSLLHETCDYGFGPAGSYYGIQRMFDKFASVFVVTFFFVSIGYRWMVGDRLMQMVASHMDFGMLFFLLAFSTSVRCLKLNPQF